MRRWIRPRLALPLLALLGPAIPARASAPSVDPWLAAPATHLEQRIADNLWDGQVVGIAYDSTDPQLQTRDHIVGAHGQPDSALWSGVYLAGESFRYAVDRNAAATTNDAQVRADALADQQDAKARIDELVSSVHLRINISKNWKARPCGPDDQPGGVHSCGVVDGEAGELFRACFPDGTPSWLQGQGAQASKEIFGPLRWDDGKDYWCEDGTSRDSYAGTTFGLLTAFDLVGPDDPTLRHQIRDDVTTMTDYLVRHGWSVVRSHTMVSTAGSENFVFPLFAINPQPQLNMTQAARHVADADGSDLDKVKWDAIWNAELAAMGPNLTTEYLLAIESPHNSYYNFNLNHLTNFNVIREEPDPTVRDYLKREFSIIDATTRDDVNAHFEAITYALTGEQARFDLALQHLKDWLVYRDNVSKTNSTRCGVDLTCITDDAVDLHQQTPLGAQTTTIPGQKTSLRSATPLPVVDRVPGADFLWQRSPYQLDGSRSLNEQEPGVDFLTPYWMLRYYTEVAPPSLAPFPAWDGPTAGGSGS